jgi:hypothetical protein
LCCDCIAYCSRVCFTCPVVRGRGKSTDE